MHANPSAAPTININTGGGGVGYVICLANLSDEVLEGAVSDAGGVQIGRMMTPDERRTGVLNRSPEPPMIDITPGQTVVRPFQPKRIRGEFDR